MLFYTYSYSYYILYKYVYRKGIGQLLYNHADVVAKEHSVNILRVDTHTINVPMNNIIKKCGYIYKGQCVLPRVEGYFNVFEKVI